MSRIENNQGLIPTVLDRLIDPESTGTRFRRGYSLQQMLDAVRRDLENLLNTRQYADEISDDFTEVRRSILNYGLPDLTPLPASTAQQRKEIGQIIERVIMTYEPRLRDVQARLKEQKDTEVESIRFEISGRLNVDPSPEVAFSTVLELETGHTSVQASGL